MSGGAWRLPASADDQATYFAHALALAALHGPGPWPRGGNPLPDEQPRPPGLWMSDAVIDGVHTHHAQSQAADATILVDCIRALANRQPTDAALRQMHDAAAAHAPLSVADSVTARLQTHNFPTERVRHIGLWLAEHGARRGAVALGIVLVGITGDARDRDLLLLLGALEDLTLYAVVALGRSQPDRDQAIFELARRVDGWGRIHAVERLRNTDDPQIKAWLLRDGFRNGIMDEYLAHIAADTGNLAEALTPDRVDEALVDGAGGILTALCDGGPAKDISDYPSGPWAIERYLTHVGHLPPTLTRIAVAGRLRNFTLSRRASALQWTAPQVDRLREIGDALAVRSDWRELVCGSLASAELEIFRKALWPAKEWGIPVAGRVAVNLRREPFDWYLWHSFIEDTDGIDDVLVLAEELLPLDDLVTGPGLDLGLGSKGPDRVLDLIVGRLKAHPGKGWALIKVGLSNSTIRNRNMALNALDAWAAGMVPAEAQAVIRQAIRLEPDDNVRERMRQLQQTWSG